MTIYYPPWNICLLQIADASIKVGKALLANYRKYPPIHYCKKLFFINIVIVYYSNLTKGTNKCRQLLREMEVLTCLTAVREK